MENVYTAKEIAAILKISYKSALVLINEGKIKSLNTNGVIRVTQTQLDNFMKGE